MPCCIQWRSEDTGEESDRHACMLDHLARPPDGGRTTSLSCSPAFDDFSHQGKCLGLLPGHVLSAVASPPPPRHSNHLADLLCFPSMVGLLHRLVPMSKGFFHIPLSFGCQFKSLCLKVTPPKPQTCYVKCG